MIRRPPIATRSDTPFPSPALFRSMAPDIVIVGAGPAGISAAHMLVQAGVRPVVVDEAPRCGGQIYRRPPPSLIRDPEKLRSEEHTSELQSLMRISYAVFCLKKKTTRVR